VPTCATVSYSAMRTAVSCGDEDACGTARSVNGTGFTVHDDNAHGYAVTRSILYGHCAVTDSD